MAASPILSCPFCSFSSSGYDNVMQHVGLYHPENDETPTVTWPDGEGGGVALSAATLHVETRSAKGLPAQSEYLECECGETIALSDFDNHRDLHLAENAGAEEPGIFNGDSDAVIEASAISPVESYPISQTYYQSPSTIRPAKSVIKEMAPVRPSRRAKDINREAQTLSSLSTLTISRNEKAGSRSNSDSTPKSRVAKPRSAPKSWIDAFIGNEASIKRSRSIAGKPGQNGLRRLGVSAIHT